MHPGWGVGPRRCSIGYGLRNQSGWRTSCFPPSMPGVKRILPLVCAWLLTAACRGAGTPLTVQLDWIPNVQFAGVLVAKEKGWYREAGLDVTIRAVDPQAMATSVETVLTGP